MMKRQGKQVCGKGSRAFPTLESDDAQLAEMLAGDEPARKEQIPAGRRPKNDQSGGGMRILSDDFDLRSAFLADGDSRAQAEAGDTSGAAAARPVAPSAPPSPVAQQRGTKTPIPPPPADEELDLAAMDAALEQALRGNARRIG